MVLFGADRIGEFRQLFAGRVALLTSPTGRTSDNRSTVDVLREVCDLRLLLAPEHGVRGDKADGLTFGDETDRESGLPARSLYSGSSKRLSEETLSLFDTLVYDIADVGCRFYTFISTLRYCIEDCSAAGKRLVVLDRPNPMGRLVEGGLLRPETMSFVGAYPLPTRYGMTCGELAEMMNDELGTNCDLHVVPCLGLTGSMTFRDWGLPWVMPSLGLPRYESALVYPGTCLIEGTNCSEGRGTGDPLAMLGAPYIRAEALCREFNAMGCPGVTATPVYFTPLDSKHKDTLCGGIQLHVMDEKISRPVAMGVRILDLLRRMYPEDFAFRGPNPGSKLPFISLLAGHRDFENPNWNAEELLCRYERESREFEERRARWLRYPEKQE